MPYIGRELDSGNYLKLDDISSSFNGSTTTFNLTVGGKAFFPGSAFSILVNLAGVAQEPEAAYQINNSQITFASAPASGDQFFCIVLGVAHGVNVPGNGTVNGAQLAKPFNYDGFFYLDDANNRVGVGTATPAKPLHVVGEGQFDSVRVLGDLTVDGTTTTLDTVVTEVDKLEVGANNNTVGVAITQSGSGANTKFTGGYVDIDTTIDSALNLNATDDGPIYSSFNRSGTRIGYYGFGGSGNTFNVVNEATGGQFNITTPSNFSITTNSAERLRIHSDGKFSFGTATAAAAKYTFNSAGTNEVARFESTDAGAYLAIKDNSSTSINFVEGGGDVLSLGVNSVERLRITTSGVGIGTADPQSQFEVYGTSPIVRSKHSTSQKYTQINHNGTDGYLDWSSGGLIFRGASNTEKVRITSGGNVGIGTVNPTSGKLHVKDGNIRISGTSENILKIRHDSSSHDSNISQTSDGSLRYRYGSNERLRITSAGKVGIGTDNPDSLLHLADTNTTVWPFANTVSGTYAYSPYPHELEIQNNARDVTGAFAGIYFNSGASPDGSYKSSARIAAIDTGNSRSDLAFGTRNTNFKERLRIRYDGNIGIGTDNPICKLVVNSGTTNLATQIVSDDAEVFLAFKDGDSTGNQQVQIGGVGNNFVAYAGGNEKLRITSAGSIGIGITNPATDVDISQKTGAVALPQGTTAQRPSGSAPYIRKNSTNNALEFYNGTEWVEIITDYFPTGSVILG